MAPLVRLLSRESSQEACQVLVRLANGQQQACATQAVAAGAVAPLVVLLGHANDEHALWAAHALSLVCTAGRDLAR
jgi:hypothetical protein